METVTYQLTVPDVVDARAHVYNRLPLVRAVRAIPFILVCGCLLYGTFAASQRDWEGAAASVGWLAVGLALLVWMYVANKWLLPGSARKQLARSRELQGDMVARWDRTAINFESSHGKSSWPWSDFSRWQETPGNLLLWRSDRLYNCLPKRALTSDQIADLRRRLRQALGEPGCRPWVSGRDLMTDLAAREDAWKLFRFDNFRKSPIGLNIEPWAYSFEIPAEGVALVEFVDPENYQMEIAALEDGSITLGLYSTDLTVKVNGVIVLELRGMTI